MADVKNEIDPKAALVAENKAKIQALDNGVQAIKKSLANARIQNSELDAMGQVLKRTENITGEQHNAFRQNFKTLENTFHGGYIAFHNVIFGNDGLINQIAALNPESDNLDEEIKQLTARTAEALDAANKTMQEQMQPVFDNAPFRKFFFDTLGNDESTKAFMKSKIELANGNLNAMKEAIGVHEKSAWESIGDFFKMIGEKIGSFFQMIARGIVHAWNAVASTVGGWFASNEASENDVNIEANGSASMSQGA